MPALIRLYMIQCALGFVISAIFVAGLLAFDIGGLRHLLLGSGEGLLALVVLWVLNGLVFAGVQFGIAIMRMAEDDTPPSGTPRMIRQLRPVQVRHSDRPD